MGQQVRYGRRRSHGAGALIAAVILVVAALIAAWTLLPRLFTPRETARTAEEAYCAAVSSDGARRTLTPDQAQNAALIANIAVTRGLPDHAATVAIATAMQESRLTNLDYGDLDSIGLFQQRPSQGWGTAEQVSDMTYATNIFYDHLLQVPDWETIPVEDAAQEVQRSGYPELYAAWDAMARAWASGLTGERSAGVTCALEPATSSDADGLVAAIGGTLPNVNVSVVPPNGKTGTNNGAATNTASTTLTITLPDGLKVIPEEAFADSAYLVRVWIPLSVKEIDTDVFQKCPELKYVLYEGTEDDWVYIFQPGITGLNSDYLYIEAPRPDDSAADVFYDVDPASWSYDGIEFCYMSGLMSGRGASI